MRNRALLAVLAMVVLAAGCGTGAGVGMGEPSTGPGHTGPTVPPSFPLLGSWTTTITRADLQAAGITDPGALNENTGRFTWTFEHDGTWRVVQVSLDDNPVLNPVFAGSYVVEGNTIVAVTEFPDAYRDTGIHYTYVLTPGPGVQFSVVDPPDSIAAIVTETHPWLPVGS